MAVTISSVEAPLREAVRRAIEESPRRRFKESVDLTVVFRGLDLKKDPSLKINEIVALPHAPKGKEAKVAVIGTGEFATKARDAGADAVFDPAEILSVAKNKRELRKLANRFDFFVAQADALPKLARDIGPIFGPRNKMPIPLPATRVDQLPDTIQRLKRSVRVRMRDQPVIHARVGSRDMDPDEIVENIKAVLAALERKYGDLGVLEAMYVKTTMGPAIRVEAAMGGRRRRR